MATRDAKAGKPAPAPKSLGQLLKQGQKAPVAKDVPSLPKALGKGGGGKDPFKMGATDMKTEMKFGGKGSAKMPKGKKSK